MDVDFSDSLSSIIGRDMLRMAALEAVRHLDLPDCWIGAGFVRDAVWDHLHGRAIIPPSGDVDVIWFDPDQVDVERDKKIGRELRKNCPDLLWSVKNQARMHIRNGDAPYISVVDAMRFWPETATAVAVRLKTEGTVEANAPFGLGDLFALRLVPSPSFACQKRHIFDQRVVDKRWLLRYPLLTCSL